MLDTIDTLVVQIAPVDAWDEQRELFVSSPAAELVLNHTLVSLTRWESKWNQAFLGRTEKTEEQLIDYVKTMNSAPVPSPEVFNYLTQEQFQEIFEWMNKNPTATTVTEEGSKRPATETITAELIYYWISALQLPIECQNWHLQRMLTLVRIANIKNSPPKKLSKGEAMAKHRALLQQRRQQYGTNG